MAYKKNNYWENWVNDATKHFNVAYTTIVAWHNPNKYTPIMLDKHNILLDWITSKLIERGFSEDTAKKYVDKQRIGREKCLEE